MKNRSVTVMVVFASLALSNVACQKPRPERAKPKAAPNAGTTVGKGAGSTLRTAAAGQVQASCDAAVKTFTGTVDKIVKIETTKRTVDNTLIAFENALAELDDQTRTQSASGYLSSETKVNEEANLCRTKRKEARDAAFSRKELYDVISAAVSAKSPEGVKKRLADFLLRRMEEKGASGSELKTKLLSLKSLEEKWEANIAGVKTASLLAIADSDARKTEYLKHQTRGAAENAKILPDLLKLRSDIATLKKKKSYADLTASEGLPKDANTVARRLLEIQEVLVKRLADQKAILAKYASEHTELGVKEVNPWDVDFLMNKYFAADSAGLKDAFDRDAVLSGIFEAVSTTFGLKIELVKDEKPIAEGIKHYSVAREKSAFANFYLYFGPKSVADHEDVSSEESASSTKLRVVTLSTARKGGKGAAAILTGNLASTLTASDVALTIRETGKLLQHLLYAGEYASLSPRALGADFRQIPSRTLENWITEATILKSVAKVSQEQAEKLIKARIFTMTYRLAGYLFSARVDNLLHGEGSKGDLSGLAEQVYTDVYGIKLDQPATAIPRLNGGLWVRLLSEASAADLYTQFAGKPTDPAVGKRFADMLAKGATVDGETLAQDFLGGRDVNPADGLKFLLK